MKSRIIVVLLFELSLTLLQAQTVNDINGNVYKTVTIGNQIWMAENLKTTKYNDGKAIPLVTDNAAWTNRDSIALTTPAYYWYNNDSTIKKTYGALYNGYAVKTDRLCPTGWHVPDDAEWSKLTAYLGGEDVAGGKLKETGTDHWQSPNKGATDESGFTALPGKFNYINGGSGWWSSTKYNSTYAWSRGMHSDTDHVSRGANELPNSLYVRCLKD